MPTIDRKLQVFLCHASQDKPIVRELYQKLAAEGWIKPKKWGGLASPPHFYLPQACFPKISTNMPNSGIDVLRKFQST
jgi:hypothetical protein